MPTQEDDILRLRDAELGSSGSKERSSNELLDYGPGPATNPAPPQANSRLSLTFWIAVNVVATITIVFTNKRLLSSPSLSRTQILFAAYHFLVTHLTLHVCSSPHLSTTTTTISSGPLFTRAAPATLALVPISVAMALNVLLPNLSLALSSVTFYQTARVLLTPTVAVLNRCFYGKAIGRGSALALIPVCVGVAMVTWSDVRPATDKAGHGLLEYWRGRKGVEVRGTSVLGAACALLGVLASSVYAVFIARYQVKLEMTAVQLLHRQSLVGGAMLLYFVPWLDRLPHWGSVSGWEWWLILLSGLCAVAINLSQFAIVRNAGPVGSTVVGHAKTIGVVGLGWWVQGDGWKERGTFGVVVAVAGIVAWTWIELKERRRRSMAEQLGKS